MKEKKNAYMHILDVLYEIYENNEVFDQFSWLRDLFIYLFIY